MGLSDIFSKEKHKRSRTMKKRTFNWGNITMFTFIFCFLLCKCLHYFLHPQQLEVNLYQLIQWDLIVEKCAVIKRKKLNDPVWVVWLIWLLMFTDLKDHSKVRKRPMVECKQLAKDSAFIKNLFVTWVYLWRPVCFTSRKTRLFCLAVVDFSHCVSKFSWNAGVMVLF